MAYVKKYNTPAERHAAHCAAGSKGALAAKLSGKKLGRPVGSKSKQPRAANPRASIPPKTMTVREDDYRVFVRLAFVSNLPIVEFMHVLAENMKAKNQEVFAGDPKVNL